MSDELPAGKIRTVGGDIIDRADAWFYLAEHKEDKSLLTAVDGTVYQKDKNGTLRRLTFKKGEQNKKGKQPIIRRSDMEDKLRGEAGNDVRPQTPGTG